MEGQISNKDKININLSSFKFHRYGRGSGNLDAEKITCKRVMIVNKTIHARNRIEKGVEKKR